MQLKNLNEALTWLQSQTKSQPKQDLIKMERALSFFPLSFDKTLKFHVAGTNGKGSVVKYITEILVASGYSVGSFMSPYVSIFNERILINGQPIEDDTLFDLIRRIYVFNQRYLKDFNEGFSFFELLTIMAFLHFSEMKLDAIVIEVGIGGLLDSTNVLLYDASIITSIGLDHVKIIGPTLNDIARNKAGIIKMGTKAFTTVDDDVYPIFEQRAKEMQVPIHHIKLDLEKMGYEMTESSQKFVYKNHTYHLKMIGAHQVRNAVLAIETVQALCPHLTDDKIAHALSKTTFEGRFEMLRSIPPKVIIDAAHNTHGIKALKVLLDTLYKNQHIYVVMSALGDKDIKEMIEIIKPVAKNIALTGFNDPRYVSLKPYATKDIPYYDHANEALHHAYLSNPDVIIVTGSIHFIGYFKNNVKL